MAAEEKRGCGYRKVGGIYLVGGFRGVPCDRIPFPLKSCPSCGSGIHFTRALTEINPLKLFGLHDDLGPIKDHFDQYPGLQALVEATGGFKQCKDPERPCFLCDPKEDPGYIMFVGEKFYPTPDHFMEEARRLGISKRLPNDNLPKNLVLGQTVIYLAHSKACVVREKDEGQNGKLALFPEESDQQKLVRAEEVKYQLGIFTAFVPRAVEKIFWQSDLDRMSDEEREKWTKRGITPVGMPDGDMDHAGKKERNE